jgi:hypothetical protein
VILYGIASRDANTARRLAKQYHFRNAYGSYEELINDPEIDAVYVSTPNGLHYEWSSKALRAGKHVLCEKPFTSNSEEASKLVAIAQEKGLVCEEAVCCYVLFHSRTVLHWSLQLTRLLQFHWQFHPAAHLFRQILESRKYGRTLRTDAVMTATPRIPEGDIRWNFDLSGM